MRARLLVALVLLFGPVWLAVAGDAVRAGRFELSVRLASEAAGLPRDTPREWDLFVGGGAASGVLGTMAPPFYASGLVVGSVLILSTVLAWSEHERRTWQTLDAALRGVDLPAAVLDAFRRRAPAALQDSEGSLVQAELVIRGFGLFGTARDRACLVVDGELAVHADGGELDRYEMRIGPAGSTPDAPPAQCASLERFREEDGQLVTEAAAEYAEVLAALTVRRLAALHEAAEAR